MMNDENDSILGPGTDLVVSLFAVSLILICMLSGLYFESVESAVITEKKIETYSSLIDGTKKVDEILQTHQLLKDENKVLKTKFGSLKLHTENIKQKKEQLEANRKNQSTKIKKLSKDLNTLKAENSVLKKQIYDKNFVISQLTATSIVKGHNNTPIPKRSTKDKRVLRIYAEGKFSNPILYYKLPGGSKKVSTSRQAMHSRLKRIKNELGSQLYVSVIVPDNYPVSIKKRLQCEFWKYDYYQYFDKNYCK